MDSEDVGIVGLTFAALALLFGGWLAFVAGVGLICLSVYLRLHERSGK